LLRLIWFESYSGSFWSQLEPIMAAAVEKGANGSQVAVADRLGQLREKGLGDCFVVLDL
jgi:hypothetical protein